MQREVESSEIDAKALMFAVARVLASACRARLVVLRRGVLILQTDTWLQLVHYKSPKDESGRRLDIDLQSGLHGVWSKLLLMTAPKEIFSKPQLAKMTLLCSFNLHHTMFSGLRLVV